MTDLERLLEDAGQFANETGRSISTVSKRLLGDGTRIGKIQRGEATAYASTIGRAIQRLEEWRREEAATPEKDAAA